jgi:hypothetical protein
MEQDLGWALESPVESGEHQQRLEDWLPLFAPWRKTCQKVRDQASAKTADPKTNWDLQKMNMDFGEA